MTDPASDETPIALDRVERTRGQGDDVRLRLSGRWLIDAPRSDPADALLVVQLQGRRHRFPASRAPSGAAPLPGTWQAEFTVPLWAVPTRAGQAAVWVGTAVIAVAPAGALPARDFGDSGRPRAAARAPEASAPEASAPEALTAEVSAAEALTAEALTAEASSAETVDTLRAELARSSEEAAELRGALADAQSELGARASRQTALETTHGELRHELEQLMAAVTRQRQDFEERTAAGTGDLERAREQATIAVAARDEAEAELLRAREQLATAHILRDAAISESAGLRAELERLGAELAVTREQVSAHNGDLGEAQSLLADARALTEQLRSAAGS